MQRNETPQLAASWWKSAQPAGLTSASELAKALAVYEDSRKTLAKEPGEASAGACLAALRAIEQAAKSVSVEAQKLKKNPPKKGDVDLDELGYTIDALAKYPRVTESVKKDIGKIAEKGKTAVASAGDDEEDEGGTLGSLDDYKEYLKKILRRMKQTPMNFAIGLGRRPDEHRLLCHRAKPAKSLQAQIKNETSLKRFAWGIAGGHSERATTLTLALESPPAPGLKKKLEKQLKLLKPLAFDRVLLMVDGEEAEDVVDPDEFVDDEFDQPADAAAADSTAPPPPPPSPPDASGVFAARLKALLPRVPQAIAADAARGNEAKLKASEAGALARQKNFTAALAALGEAESIVDAVLGGGAPQVKAATGTKAVFTQSRLAWNAARTKVHGELQKLEGAILETYKDYDVYDEVRNAVRMLDGILENLDESLADKLDEALNAADPAQHARLHDEARGIVKRYRDFLDSDPLVRAVDDNPFVPVAVQSTLDKTLALLESKLV